MRRGYGSGVAGTEEATMMLRDAAKRMGRGARSTAGSMRHSVQARTQERRLEKTSEEATRLRAENEALREEVAEARTERHRILDLLESRFSEPPEIEVEVNGHKKSHKGRWFLFLAAIGGGAYALIRRRSGGRQDEWTQLEDRPLSGTGVSAT